MTWVNLVLDYVHLQYISVCLGNLYLLWCLFLGTSFMEWPQQKPPLAPVGTLHLCILHFFLSSYSPHSATFTLLHTLNTLLWGSHHHKPAASTLLLVISSHPSFPGHQITSGYCVLLPPPLCTSLLLILHYKFSILSPSILYYCTYLSDMLFPLLGS